MMWALEDPRRFLQEKAALEALAAEVDWIRAFTWGTTKAILLKVDLDIVIADRVYDLELVYPNLFPDTAAFVRPRSPVRLSPHQYGAGGTLCLEWRPDNWHPEITGADLLRSARTLLSAESGNNQTMTTVPSAHEQTLGQAIRGQRARLVVTSTVLDFLNGLPVHSQHALHAQAVVHKTASVLFISKVERELGEPFRPDDLPTGITEYSPLFAYNRFGLLFKSSRFGDLSAVDAVGSVVDAIRNAGFPDFVLPPKPDDRGTNEAFLFVLVGEQGELQALSSEIYGDKTVTQVAVIRPHRTHERRLPSTHDSFVTKRVGIVGLGSVGSKIARSVARSGVRKFVLVDDDVLLPENICRQDLDWASVGVNKAAATKEVLQLIAAGIEVDVCDARVAGQESAYYTAAVLDKLADCDVIIDATANPSVFLQLAAINRRKKKALVWGELFAGGIGALVARSRPDKDSTAMDVRAGVYGYLQKQPAAPFELATGYDAADDAGAPLLANDAEVMHVASVMIRFALDILVDPPESEFPSSAYLLGLKKQWIFTAPFDTHPINVESSPERPVEPAASEEESKEAADLLGRLLKPYLDADPASSS